MKKVVIFILVLMTQQLVAQTNLSTSQTTDLFMRTNYLYCETLDIIIRSMFEYDEQKFEAALDSLQIVIKNYNKINEEGSFTSSLKRQAASMYLWSARSLFFDKNLYKTGERNKKVTYGIDHRITKGLKKQFDKLVEVHNRVCLENMY